MIDGKFQRAWVHGMLAPLVTFGASSFSDSQFSEKFAPNFEGAKVEEVTGLPEWVVSRRLSGKPRPLGA